MNVSLPPTWEGQHFHASLPVPRDSRALEPLPKESLSHRCSIRCCSLAARSPEMGRGAPKCQPYPLLSRDWDLYGSDGFIGSLPADSKSDLTAPLHTSDSRFGTTGTHKHPSFSRTVPHRACCSSPLGTRSSQKTN